MIKNKRIIRKMAIFGLSLVTSIPLSPIQQVMAAADGSGSLTFDCGEGATTCPSRIDFPSNGSDLWKDTVGEKPIPTKPGSQFVDWELVFGNGDLVKPGDLLTDWNTYTVGDLNGYGGGNVIVKAVWNSGNDSTVPITISVPSTPINVTLPSSIELGFNGTDINAAVPNNLIIQNNSSVGTVKVSEVKASLKDSTWTLSSDSSDETYKNLPLDSKQIYLGFGKNTSSFTPLAITGFDPEISVSPQNVGENTQAFVIEAKTGGTSSAINSNLFDLEMTLEYDKVDEVVPITIFIDGKENILEKNTFTFPEGTASGLGNIQGYNKIKNSKAVMNLSDESISDGNEYSLTSYSKVSTPNINALFTYFDLKLKETADLPYNCIGSSIDFARSYLVEMSEFVDIDDQQSNIIKNNIEAMINYWRYYLKDSGCVWEQGSKTFSYIPSKSFYINVIYDLEEFTQAMFNSIGLTIRSNFKDLNWKAYDGDVEKGKIDWPHYIDYRPGTTIEVTDGDSFYSIAG